MTQEDVIRLKRIENRESQEGEYVCRFDSRELRIYKVLAYSLLPRQGKAKKKKERETLGAGGEKKKISRANWRGGHELGPIV